MKITALNAIDVYKLAHREQYPKGTTLVFSNFTPRSDKYFKRVIQNDKKKAVVNFGLSAFVKWYLIELWNETFFNRPLFEVIQEYKTRVEGILGKDAITYKHIEDLHKLGYLPLEIRALPEGTISPIGVPVYTIHNTLPDFYWLTNYLESVMSSETWKITTGATIAYEYYKICNHYAELTCDNKDHLPFQCHDFSFRGMSGLHDASQVGAGHLLFFSGTDSVLAIDYLQNYYPTKENQIPFAVSISASEHSTATTNIAVIVSELKEQEEHKHKTEDELRGLAESIFFKQYITEIYPTGFCSYVADSYDYWRVLTDISKEHKELILARDGRLVYRPDTGVPEDVICGDVEVIPYEEDDDYTKTVEDYAETVLNYYAWNKAEEALWGIGFGGSTEQEIIFMFKEQTFKAKFDAEYNRVGEKSYYLDNLYFEGVEPYELTPENKGSIQFLWEIFGGTINEKGYKVLNPKVGLIYGDSITLERMDIILKRLKDKGFASSNVVGGIGSFSYNFNTRDSLGFAVKATGAIVNGKEVLVCKEPKTDSGKKSAKGFLKVVNENGELKLKDQLNLNDIQSGDNELKVLFKDGELFFNDDFNTIKQRALSQVE